MNTYFLEFDDERSDGFASCEIGNKLSEEEQWAKLGLVKEVAGTLIVSDHNSYQKTNRGMQCVPVFLKLETDCFIFRISYNVLMVALFNIFECIFD